MLTRCCICGMALAVPDDDEDSALCAGCLLANFGGATAPEWGRPRLVVLPPAGAPRRPAPRACGLRRRWEEDPHA